MKIDDIHEMAHDIKKYVNEHHMLKSLNHQLFDENERLNTIIDELEERLDKAIEILKDTSVDMPSTLLMETIDYARHILGDKENE